jgi:predicted MFS family arabinose efflux permease
MIGWLLGGIATGVAHGVIFPSLMGEVVNRARLSERGSAMATLTSIGDVAFLAGAPLVGVTIEQIGYLAAFLIVGVAVLVGSVVYGQWDRRTDPATRVPEDVLE